MNWALVASVPFRLMQMNVQKLLTDLTSGAAKLAKGCVVSALRPGHAGCARPCTAHARGAAVGLLPVFFLGLLLACFLACFRPASWLR